MHVLKAAVTLLLVGLASAGNSRFHRRDGARQAKDQILDISPGSKSCPDTTGECYTAEQAAPYLINAMLKYEIYAPGEIAAVLSLQGLESADYHYRHNVFPGRPGQGTAAMFMPNYVMEYALSIPELKPKVAALTPATTPDGLSNSTLNAILALVTADEYNFAAGAWFLTNKCSAEVRSGLASASDKGWSDYHACIGTPVTDDRTAYWTRAKAAFGLS